ncbi:MAG TPA: ABC transporter permease subunit [Chloroflexota bacterium]|nr:ABC transporter permease subunit [Chloroflexota bacterium]
MNTLRIAHLTFREAVRRKALYGAMLLTVGFLGLYGWGTGVAVRELVAEVPRGLARVAEQIGQDLTVLAIGELFLAGLFAVSNIAGLLAIFMAAGNIALEVDQGTLHAIVPKPLARWEVVGGKWLGGAAMLAVYVTVTSLATAAIIYLRTGYSSPALPVGIALLVLKATLLYSVTLVGSSVLPTIATGISMFIVYVIANVAGLVEQLGRAFEVETMVKIGVYASIVLPSDALWKMAAHAVQPPNPLPALGINLSIGPFGVVFPPSVWMGVYGVVYTLVALGLASWLFSRRDL